MLGDCVGPEPIHGRQRADRSLALFPQCVFDSSGLEACIDVGSVNRSDVPSAVATDGAVDSVAGGVGLLSDPPAPDSDCLPAATRHFPQVWSVVY